MARRRRFQWHGICIYYCMSRKAGIAAAILRGLVRHVQ